MLRCLFINKFFIASFFCTVSAAAPDGSGAGAGPCSERWGMQSRQPGLLSLPWEEECLKEVPAHRPSPVPPLGRPATCVGSSVCVSPGSECP